MSDNGPPFASAEFKQFMNANGVNHHQVPPYHLSSNGVAEEKVEKSANIQTIISRFLLVTATLLTQLKVEHLLKYYWVDYHI